MEEFFNSLEEKLQRSECKRSENAFHIQPEQKVSRPTCTATVWSTERSTDYTTQFLLRVGLARASVGFGRPKEGSVGSLVLSGFELRF